MSASVPFFSKDIAHAFNKAARTYDAHAVIQQEIGQRLLNRLPLVSHKPKTVLDLGSGTGTLTQQLRQQFPKSYLIGIDLAFAMTHYAAKHSSLNTRYLCGDASRLPLQSHTIDLVFSNLTLQWCYPLPEVIKEIYRVSKPGAEFFFATLGPQTLYELRESFNGIDEHAHVNDFHDLITVGNALQSAGFIEPVVDREIITFTYRDIRSLFKILKATGAQNKQLERNKGCLSTQRFHQLIRNYAQFKCPDEQYPATFEVIYGHAKKTTKPLYRQDENGLVHIPAHNIPRLSAQN